MPDKRLQQRAYKIGQALAGRWHGSINGFFGYKIAHA
ncbi:MAG: hypothetical protein GDA56_13505 [Hormoscilla sp. GM7CHS1pb]|nr:hypothetical protein [Hormoscilla sp. GM7CHS1pb]